MQVDTRRLREAAAQLRQDVAGQLHKAVDVPFALLPAGAFDRYATAAPYAEAALAWSAEIDLLIRATGQLADALERAADDYDRADARAAQRLTAPR